MDLIPFLALRQVDIPLVIILAVHKLITKGLYNENISKKRLILQRESQLHEVSSNTQGKPRRVLKIIIQWKINQKNLYGNTSSVCHKNHQNQLVTIQNLKTFIESDEYPATSTSYLAYPATPILQPSSHPEYSQASYTSQLQPFQPPPANPVFQSR